MERWVAVPGFEGLYEASTYGRVRSLDRMIEHWRGGLRVSPGRILRPGVLKNGRLQVTLRKDGVGHQRKVHQVIALTFHGPCPEDMEVRHWPDRDVTNNRPENLCYGTKRDNQLDSMKHGTHKELRKTKCPRGHLLQTPNLRTDRLNKWRECLSCNKARWIIRSRPDLDFKVVSDACYEEIVHGAINPYHRTKSEAQLQRHHFGSTFAVGH